MGKFDSLLKSPDLLSLNKNNVCNYFNRERIHFPTYFSPASAGSGKTYALAFRILRLLLSDKKRTERPPNLLAMTFTKNAAAEMRQRVLKYLKQARSATGNARAASQHASP